MEEAMTWEREMPPPVEDVTTYWGDDDQPPEPSPRFWWWLDYLSRTKLSPEERSALYADGGNYHDHAEKFGVYLWEWCNVLVHVMDAKAEAARVNSMLSERERVIVGGGQVCGKEQPLTRCIFEPGHEGPHADQNGRRWGGRNRPVRLQAVTDV